MSKYWTRTYTGIAFDLLEPTLKMIDVRDIAHHLSIENRFGGASKFPYSVGYHSLLMCRFASDEFKLEYLFHDASEAYYKDIPKPLKNLISNVDQIYTVLCSGFDSLLTRKFKLDFKSCKLELHEADLRMAKTEFNQLMNGHSQPEIESKIPFDVEIVEKSPEYIEKMFLNAFEEYKRS